MFPHANRLTKSKDIQRIISTGKRYTTPHLRIYWITTALPQPRLTVVVSKKTAKLAVTRNRIKRRVRAALHGLEGLTSVDVVAFPNQTIPALPFEVINEELHHWQERL